MSNLYRLPPSTVEPFEDRIDSLFREVELSVKWQRPSILVAVYKSEYIHSAAEADLEQKLASVEQKVVRISIENAKDADLTSRLSEAGAVQNAVFFINGLRWGCLDGANLYQDLNNQREFFVEKRLRLVFWLTEKEVIDLANKAPDFWAFRHRVIDFNDSPNPEKILQDVAESSWQGTGEYADPGEDIDAKISFRETLLTNLPEGNESAAVNGNLLLTLGILHWRKGDFEKATEFLNAALDVAIKMKDKIFAAECFNAIALVKTGLGRTDEAIQAYQRAIQLAPTQLFPWNNLGFLFCKLDRHEEAVVAFKKAIENKPGDAVSWNGLGEVYLRLNKPDEAISAYLKAIELTPNYHSAWCGLGSAFYKVDKQDQAFKAYQKAFTLNNRSISSIVGLAKVLAAQGKENHAVQAYEAALKIDPKDASIWNQMGSLCMKTGSHEKAVVCFGKAVEISPQNGEYISNQAQAYLEMGVHLEAIPLFEKSLTLFDSDDEKAATWNRLANAYRQIGDYNRAVSAYQIADEFGGGSSATLPTLEPEQVIPSEAAEQFVDEPDCSISTEESLAVSSSLDVKESRIESITEYPEDTLELSLQNDDSAQVLDGDHLHMLDKTLSEIEELISKQKSLLEANESGDATIMSNDNSDGEDGIADAILNALEWNELGNTHLVSGSYDEAIFAYTRAIELAPEFNWPYIKNLAMAYYQKGKSLQDTEDVDDVNAEENDEPGEADQGIETMHELHQLSSEIFSTSLPVEESASETTTTSTLQDETEYSLDSSSLVEPFTFDVSTLKRDLIQEAMQEDMEFTSGKIRDVIPASREIVEKNMPAKTYGADDEESKLPEPENTSGADKFNVQPKSAYEWNELGNIYLKIGSNDKAIEAFNKSIAMDPYFGWAYSNLALAYNHSKKFQESIPLYKKSIELIDTDKGKAISYNRLGDVYRHLNDQENAMKAYQMASDLDGNAKPILARARMVLLNNV